MADHILDERDRFLEGDVDTGADHLGNTYVDAHGSAARTAAGGLNAICAPPVTRLNSEAPQAELLPSRRCRGLHADDLTRLVDRALPRGVGSGIFEPYRSEPFVEPRI